MADPKRHGARKLNAKELVDQHAEEIDVSDLKGRRRFIRILDKEYEEGLSDKMTAHAAREHYLNRYLGKPVTPVDVQTTVIAQSVEQSLQSVRETLAAAKARTQQPTPITPTTERVQ